MNNTEKDCTTNSTLIQHLENLPDEILNAPRFLPVNENKHPKLTEWQKPENQKSAAQICGLKGFDICGHGRAVDYLLIDFDHVLDDVGNFLYPDAEKWYNFISQSDDNVFCERSISGHGLHILVAPTAGKFPKITNSERNIICFDKSTGAKIELFYLNKARYCLVTGDLFRCEKNATVPHDEVADEIFQQLLNAIAKNQPEQTPKVQTQPQSHRNNQRNDYPADTPEYTLFRAKRMLDVISPAELSDSDWIAVNSSCKTENVDYSVVDAFNRQDPERYNEEENRERWDSFNDPSYNIETLHGIAKRFGYSEADTQREWRDQYPNARRQSEITTKGKIPDCPVDLILPPGVSFNAQGITLVEKPRKEGNSPRQLMAATTPIVPTKILRDEMSGLVQYELAILTQGKWRRHVVDGRTIQSTRCIDKLANFGALIKPTPLCEYFTRIIAVNVDRLKEWRVFAQPGWKDETFQEFIYPTGGENYLVDRAGYNYTVDFSERGTADDWRQVFCDAMNVGGRLARLCTGVAVAAPLIRPLKSTHLQVHLFGGINSGKTVLARLIASIWGNPQELLQTFESSPKRRQADAAAYNDLPTFYDELETVRGQRAEASLTQSVYAFFNGKGNQNMNVDGTAREKFKFTGSRLSTGERKMLKVTDQFGAYKRLVQIECKSKIFDKQLATKIFRFTADNFGHFGRGWTTYIAEHLLTIREKYEAQERLLLSDDTHEETQLRTICAAFVAYQFFAQYVGLQDKFDESTYLEDLADTIDGLPTAEESSDSTRALEVLKDFVASNEGSFYIETTNKNVPFKEYPPTNHGVSYGKLFLDGGVAIIPTELRKILYKAGFAAPEMIIRTWSDEGKIETTKRKGGYRRLRINKKLTDTLYFKPEILSEPREDKADDDDDIIPPPT